MIKKLFVLLAFIAFEMNVNAQTSLVKTNPIGYAFGTFSVSYEKVLNDKTSLVFSGNYNNGEFRDVDATLFAAGIGYRIYLTKKEAPRGFYLMPNIDIGSGTEDITEASFLVTSLGTDFGYQWIWNSGYAIDLGIRLDYKMISGDDTTLKSGALPNAVFGFGIVF